jgi:predicted nuclease of predicted toxin-antitoxin system
MRALDWPLLADENVHVVAALIARGKQVVTVRAHGAGLDDDEILALAHEAGQVVITHDADFGTLAVRLGQPFTGIIYLRPGHIRPSYVLEMINAIERAELEVEAPFIVVAERKGEDVRIRARPR